MLTRYSTVCVALLTLAGCTASEKSKSQYEKGTSGDAKVQQDASANSKGKGGSLAFTMPTLTKTDAPPASVVIMVLPSEGCWKKQPFLEDKDQKAPIAVPTAAPDEEMASMSLHKHDDWSQPSSGDDDDPEMAQWQDYHHGHGGGQADWGHWDDGKGGKWADNGPKNDDYRPSKPDKEDFGDMKPKRPDDFKMGNCQPVKGEFPYDPGTPLKLDAVPIGIHIIVIAVKAQDGHLLEIGKGKVDVVEGVTATADVAVHPVGPKTGGVLVNVVEEGAQPPTPPAETDAGMGDAGSVDGGGADGGAVSIGTSDDTVVDED